jgi:hypothetical protein
LLNCPKKNPKIVELTLSQIAVINVTVAYDKLSALLEVRNFQCVRNECMVMKYREQTYVYIDV